MKREHSPFWDQPVVPTPSIDLGAMGSYRRRAFPATGAPLPWLDQPDAVARISERLASGEITAEEAAWCRKWAIDGYLILDEFYSKEVMDRTWGEYESAIAQGRAKPEPHPVYYEGDPLPGRLQNVHLFVPAIDGMLHEPRINHVMSVILGAKARPFQTIIGHKATEQPEHSDSIHVTTYPAGYLAATWLAYEDIGPDCGPIVFYPGSHKLPYLLSEDLGIAPDGTNPAGLDYASYNTRYEPAIQAVIADNGLKPQLFMAKRGSVLIWHANLLHGGSKMVNRKSSRKALVCHYIAEGVISYHDLFGTLSYVQLGLNLYPPKLPVPPVPAPPAAPPGILRRALSKLRQTVSGRPG